MFDVVALGESLIDFTPNGTNAQGIELFARNPGGAPANVLAMNARLGGKTAFIGKVGKDGFGDFLRQTLVESSIDVSGLVIDEKIPTTLAFVQLDSKGDRSFTFYRNPGADVMLTQRPCSGNAVNRSSYPAGVCGCSDFQQTYGPLRNCPGSRRHAVHHRNHRSH